ncbi:MAG TPA: YidC/Oxa1 family membrane protein insertase [Defluviitaleaceae bacterium]|nr:YidC/Oxa1 family membrane protein insertase [Defluviitaleaceae bacterium]
MIDALAQILGFFLDFIFNFVYNILPVGSLGISIIAFTILVRLLMIPLMVKQQSSLKKMQLIQPELQKIQEKYKNKKDPDSQMQMNIEMREFYKKNNVSPFGGCFPLFIQMPIFIALFRVLRSVNTYISKLQELYYDLATQIVSADGYQQILRDVLANNKRITINKVEETVLSSAEGLQTILSQVSTNEWSRLSESLGTISNNLIEQKNNIEYFFGISLVDSPADLLSQGITATVLLVVILFPLLSALTTFISSKLISSNQQQQKNDQAEQIQKSMNMFLPIMTGMMAFSLPAGLGIYWIVSNIIQIIQQLAINKFMDKSGEGE